MNPDVPTPLVNTAVSQQDRWRPALHPDYSRVDDRSLPELLDFAARFGRLINYYDLENTVQGDWSEFFSRDPVLVLASIAATDVAGMERELAMLARRIREERTGERKRELLDRLLDSALDLPRRVDRWLHAMEARDASGTTRLVHARIAADVRDHLGRELRLLRSWDIARSESQPRDDSDFNLLWSVRTAEPDQTVSPGDTELEKIDASLPHIIGAWQRVSDSVARWADAARSQIAAIIEESNGRHQPHVALFVAFAHLVAIAQESINDFSTRRADFYFRRVLRDENLKPLPDSVYVAFDAAPSPVPVSLTIPRHTRLLAGKDAQGRERSYESCDDLTVTGAMLAMVRTVRSVMGPLLPRETGSVVERIVSRQMTRDDANASGFSTFGHAADEPAAIGFVVGAPTLWLRGGRRSVTLAFRCAPAQPATNEVLARLNLATGLDNDQILQKLLEHAFALSVSTSAGWVPVETYTVDLVPGRGGPGFALRFVLGADMPPVAPFPDSPLAAERPAVRAQLRQQRVTFDEGRIAFGAYPLSILAGLAIVSVDVQVRVEELSPAAVENSGGVVDTTRPFAAFGAVPAVGSYLRLREPELFMKDVNALALRIRWFALPAAETGFQGYYRGYVIGPNGLPQERLFDNQVFRAAVVQERGPSGSVRQESRSEHYLFRTVAERSDPIPERDGRLSTWTVFEKLSMTSAQRPADDGGPHTSLRVELAAPAYAFGNNLYAQNVLHAATSAQTDAACEASCQAEYAFLLHTARSVESVLPPLTQTGIRGRLVEATRTLRGLRTRADTVGANRAATLARLADAAYESLAACLAEWQERFTPPQLSALQEQLAACRVGPALEKLSASEALRSQLRAAAAAAGTDSASTHLDRCDLIISAAWWVRDSDAGYSDGSEWGYRRTVRTNLIRCIRELRARYDSAIKTCKENCLHGERRQLRPNPPYMPEIEAVSFDYSAGGPATFLAHLLPFDGHRQLDPAGPAFPPLLPAFAHAGNLYLGFTRFDGPQTLPIYMRMGKGHDVTPSAISWACLSGNRWLSIPSPPSRADATRGLQTSGIVTVTVPRIENPRAGTVMPGPLEWIRAAIAARPDDVPPMLGIYAHAVKATRHVAGNDVRLDEPLPPRTITALAKPVKGIGSVTQPGASFGGRAAESDPAFHVRMSERLRHKNRAILAWDYEHIVLERFPTVWKVRVLPARRRRAGDPVSVAGAVRVIVVPGPTSPDVADPTAPTCSAETLAGITETLRQAAGTFVHPQVLNPIYVRTAVTAMVRWRDGEDPRISAGRLSDEIKAYLSPWGTDVRGGRGVSEPELAEFVQSRGYVELVTAIEIEHDQAECLASEPERCFITTAAAHVIHDEAAIAVPVQEND